MHDIVRSELILGGQKSGKSRRAEQLASQWLATPGHDAVLVATGEPLDEEMTERIARHRRERAARVPGLGTLEEPLALPAALERLGAPHRLVIIDCLTLWLTRQMMPASGPALTAAQRLDWQQQLCEQIAATPGPVVVVGNEIGLGVIPATPEVRRFVDALGVLNQAVAAACARVTLMVAGCPLVVKAAA